MKIRYATGRGIGMRVWCLVAIAAASFVSGCDRKIEKPTEVAVVSPQLSTNADPGPTNDSTVEKIEVAEEETRGQNLSASQLNAVRTAEQYISMTGFSRDGLINQLSSDAGDGYSVSDATAAVDSLSVDWNENAARTARQYLDMSGFSCNGLIEQLSSDAGDKYTVAQATYGARQAGAC